MKKYAISINGTLFYIFPLSERPADSGKITDEVTDGAYALAVYPSDKVDFSVECYDKNNVKLKEPILPISALSFFFKEIRGLPLDEAEIEYFGKKYILPIRNEYRPSESVKTIKSKLKFTKSHIFDDGVEMSSYDYTSDASFRCFVTDDADCLSMRTLEGARVTKDALLFDAVIGVSYNGEIRIKATSCDFVFLIILITVCVLNESGADIGCGELKVLFNQKERHISVSADGTVTLLPKIKFLGVFN